MAKESDLRYARTWGTPIGQECITLKVSLANWLGPRLLFLAEHAHQGTGELREFADTMARHGRALARYGESEDQEQEAALAMRWVAENFTALWN